MKDYVLVFTEGADLYNLEKQLKFFPESYIFRAPCSDDYYTLENCINEALAKGYDSFHWITIREDWAELEDELNKEIKGFKELKVIPATYGKARLSEAANNNTVEIQHSIVVFPYNLLKFQGGKPKWADIKPAGKFIHGFIPLSDAKLFGAQIQQHDVNCDEAYVLAYQYADQFDRNIKTSQFDAIWGGKNEEGAVIVDSRSENAQTPVSIGDPNFLSLVLNKSGAIQQGKILPTEVFIEEDWVEPLQTQAKSFTQAYIRIVGIKGTKTGFKRNQQFINLYHQMENSVMKLSPEEKAKFQNVDYENIPLGGVRQPRTLDSVDNYIFQILQLNNYNVTNNITNNIRQQFTNNNYTQICVANGWQTIGEGIKNALLIDQLQNDVEGTWAEWLIKGGKHAAKMATNAGGYRDEQNQKLANVVAAFTKDPTKIPRPENDPNWSKLSYEEKQKRLDDYQLRVAKSQALMNHLLKKRNDQMLTDKQRDEAFNQQSYQLGSETQIAQQSKQISNVLNFCQTQLENDNLDKGKRDQLEKLRSQARQLLTNLSNSDIHDYSDKDRRDGTEYNSKNLDAYMQLLGLAQNLGYTQGDINSFAKISRKQAFAGTELDKRKRKENEQQKSIEMENIKKNFFALPEYTTLKQQLCL